MRWISQTPAAWMGLVLLIAIVAAIAHATLSIRANARMEFLLGLMKGFPADESSGARSDETPPGQLPQGI
jgi:hypothetical protein